MSELYTTLFLGLPLMLGDEVWHEQRWLVFMKNNLPPKADDRQHRRPKSIIKIIQATGEDDTEALLNGCLKYMTSRGYGRWPDQLSLMRAFCKKYGYGSWKPAYVLDNPYAMAAFIQFHRFGNFKYFIDQRATTPRSERPEPLRPYTREQVRRRRHYD